MPPNSFDIVRRLRIPGYFVMTMLSVIPVVELLAAAFPPQIHQPAWRFGLVGASGAMAITTILGLFFIFTIAMISGDRAVLWVVSGFCAAAAVLCLGAAGMFPLDALQMRAQVKPEGITRYNAASAVAFLKILSACVVYATLAISSYRAGGRSSTESVRDRGAAASKLVVGQAPVRTGVN